MPIIDLEDSNINMEIEENQENNSEEKNKEGKTGYQSENNGIYIIFYYDYFYIFA